MGTLWLRTVTWNFLGQTKHSRRSVNPAISQANVHDVRMTVGVIDFANLANLALHDAFGFARAGTLRTSATNSVAG